LERLRLISLERLHVFLLNVLKASKLLNLKLFNLFDASSYERFGLLKLSELEQIDSGADKCRVHGWLDERRSLEPFEC